MENNERDAKYPSTEYLARLRNITLLCFAGGILLLVISFLPIARNMVVGLVAGSVIIAVGVGWLLANNPKNKKIGAVITSIGIIAALSSVPVKPVMAVMRFLMVIICIGLLVYGLVNLIRYFSIQDNR
ncbi:MAG: hypothetical protein FWH41_03565 [Treponema sp.]|nr:hypothetical protein [Treponema sp.]